MSNNALGGLMIKGSIAGRSRRNVGEKKIELVTYKVYGGTKVFFVKDWAPKDYFPVGEEVELPVTIKTFQKDGYVMIDYTICGYAASDEEF